MEIIVLMGACGCFLIIRNLWQRGVLQSWLHRLAVARRARRLAAGQRYPVVDARWIEVSSDADVSNQAQSRLDELLRDFEFQQQFIKCDSSLRWQQKREQIKMLANQEWFLERVRQKSEEKWGTEAAERILEEIRRGLTDWQFAEQRGGSR